MATSRAAHTNESSPSTLFTGVGEARAAVWTVTPLAGSQNLRITIESHGFSAVPVEGGFSLRIPGQVASAKPGTPDVPRLAIMLPGVKGYRAVLTLEGKDPTNVMDVGVASSEGFRLDDPESPMRVLKAYRKPDPGIFGKDQLWPSELCRLEEGSIGTQKVVRVECCPLQYNPLTRMIRFYRRLEGELRFEPKTSVLE